MLTESEIQNNQLLATSRKNWISVLTKSIRVEPGNISKDLIKLSKFWEIFAANYTIFTAGEQK